MRIESEKGDQAGALFQLAAGVKRLGARTPYDRKIRADAFKTLDGLASILMDESRAEAELSPGCFECGRDVEVCRGCR